MRVPDPWRSALACIVLFVAGCPEGSKPPPAPRSASVPAAARVPDPEVARRRGLAPERVARGAELYASHCAACHGARGEGAANWHKPGPDGKYPPPPLDGSAHDWHHPRSALRYTIREGTARLGGNMPAWKDKLSDADVEAIIDWIVARWPEEVYAAWLEIERKSAGR